MMLVLYESALVEKRTCVRSDAIVHELELKYFGGSVNRVGIDYDGMEGNHKLFRMGDITTGIDHLDQNNTQKDRLKITARQALLSNAFATIYAMQNIFMSRATGYIRFELDITVAKKTLKGLPALEFSFDLRNAGDNVQATEKVYKFKTYYFV